MNGLDRFLGALSPLGEMLKFDARALKFVTPASKNCPCENP